MIIDLPDPTSPPPPTPAKCNPQPQTPNLAQACIKGDCDDLIQIDVTRNLKTVTISGKFDIWYFTPDQALTVAHTILGYVNKITGGEPRYVVGTITTAEPTFLYAPEDMGAS